MFSEINQNSVVFNIDDEACTYIVPHYIGSCQQILKNGFVPSCALSLLCSTSLEFFCKQIKGTKLQISFMTKPQLPNLQQTVANTILITNISNSNNLNKFSVGIFTSKGHINQV